MSQMEFGTYNDFVDHVEDLRSAGVRLINLDVVKAGLDTFGIALKVAEDGDYYERGYMDGFKDGQETPTWDELTLEKILEHRSEGWSYAKIAEEYGELIGSVLSILRAAGHRT